MTVAQQPRAFSTVAEDPGSVLNSYIRLLRATCNCSSRDTSCSSDCGRSLMWVVHISAHRHTHINTVDLLKDNMFACVWGPGLCGVQADVLQELCPISSLVNLAVSCPTASLSLYSRSHTLAPTTLLALASVFYWTIRNTGN